LSKKKKKTFEEELLGFDSEWHDVVEEDNDDSDG
jgi:hypothetical protein